MQNDTCYILALVKRDDGERLLLGSGYYTFTEGQKHFAPNLFANDVVELQGTDGQLLAGQVRRSTAQVFDGYIGDGTTPKQTVEQKRREFFLFFRKQHHYTVVYIMPDGTAIKRDRGYIVEAPAVQELYQVQPKYHIALAFEDVNYYSYAEDAQGNEIYAFDAELKLANITDGGLIWDNDGAISSPTGLGNIRINGDTFQQTYTGKNLFDKNSPNMFVGYVGWNGAISSTSVDRMIYIPCEPSTTYSIQKPIPSANPKFRVAVSTDVPANGGTATVLTNDSYMSLGKATVTTRKDSAYLMVYIWVDWSDMTLDEVLSGVQIEKSATVTSFEPYVGGVPSPNPDYPQPIQTVTGEQTVTINGTDYPLNLGKNLFDKDSSSYIFRGYLGTSNCRYNGSSWSIVVPVTAGQTYTFSRPNTTSQAGDSSYAFVSRTPQDGMTYVGSRTAVNSNLTFTATAPSGAAYLMYYFSWNASTSTAEDVMSGYQVEVGSTATAYSAYKTPIELCKLGDYQDCIHKDGDDWKVHKEIGYEKKLTDIAGIDGYASVYGTATTSNGAFSVLSSNWGSDYATTAGVAMASSVIGVYRSQNLSGNNAANSMVDGTFCQRQGTNDRVYFRFASWARSKTVNEVNQIITGNGGIDVLYPLSTPTDTAITDATLIAQLDAIEEAMSADGEPTAIVPAGNNLAAIITGDPNGTGGYVWAPSTGGGPVTVQVNGVDAANPVWHVYGSCTNPTLTNSTTGQALTWNGTVPAGQELIIDMGAQTATLEGANVFEFVSGSWVTLAPGTNRISYTAANTTAASRVYWNEVVG